MEHFFDIERYLYFKFDQNEDLLKSVVLEPVGYQWSAC